MPPPADDGGIAGARELLARAARITVLCGAGISTDSGIPDFRGPRGVWTLDPQAEKRSTIAHYLASRDHRVAAWRTRLEHPAWTAHPNPGHTALVDLERQGRLAGLVTQNIDGLHLAAGNSADLVVEIHGNLRESECLSCGARQPMAQTLERVRHGEDDPDCPVCGGILKSATISFGQALRRRDWERATAAAQAGDLFLAVGTRLEVQPAATLPALALRRGVPLLILNAEPTPFDHRAACLIREPISSALPTLLRPPHPS